MKPFLEFKFKTLFCHFKNDEIEACITREEFNRLYKLFKLTLEKEDMPRNKTFDNLMDEIKELHSKKNHDYAADNNPYSNFEFSAQLVAQFTNPVDQVFAGIIGIKIARLGQLLGQGKKPNNESVRDSMRDLTTYCGIWCSWREDNTLHEASRDAYDKPLPDPDPYRTMGKSIPYHNQYHDTNEWKDDE